MCLIVNVKFATKEDAKRAKKGYLVAKEDINVYKALRLSMYGNYVTPHQSFIFHIGMHYYQVKDSDSDKFTFTVEPYTERYVTEYWRLKVYKGLHACTSKEKAKTHADYVVRMVIPKGAKYFKGINGDIVTDNLIWPHGRKARL